MTPAWVLDWQQAAEAGPARCGGKGWNLGRLARYGFPVPAGGVLVSDAYTRLMSAPGLASLQAELSGATAGDIDHPEVGARLTALQAGLRAADLPGRVSAAVRAFL